MTSIESHTLTYLYAILPGDVEDPPGDLTGLEDAPVRVLRFGRIAAAVSTLPAAVYADEPLNARLDDLRWVGERGLAHERVVDWFAERGPAIPLSLFSLHRDETRLEERILSEADEYARLLDRLRGRREWGIKLWRREAAAREKVDEVSPSLRELSAEIEKAAPGRRFLLERRREEVRTEEVRLMSRRAVHESFAELRAAAERGVSIPLPPNARGTERTLLLHAAFLVTDEKFEEFRRVVGEIAGRLSQSGLEVEFTGPWPPYHFASPDDE